MKLQKTWAGVVLSGLLLVGCGGGSSISDNHEDALPAGLTFIMFDNATGDQYSYDTEHREFENMNGEGEKYDMTGKNGKLVVWTHHMVDADGNETEEQKVVMLNDVDYNILNDDDNVTHDNIHYLGHFHDDGFAAHSADEFDPAVETNETKLEKKQAALDSLSEHLWEQEEIREELEEALSNVNATGDLCNFIVLGEHEEHDDNVIHEEHGTPHIAMTTDGYVYVFEENATTHELVQDGIHFLLDGVTNCTETESDILQVGESGVAIFSAETQKLYLVDKHEDDESSTYGTDFHVHSTVEISEIMPAGFTPTSVAAIGEGEHDHDH
ncbi:hypothetical protein [Sulfurovum sp.]|jgi:hypothetical protein|uniref:hypothetical protein n=1 Tax=Sulfurovum sp. TaxID=1969726 RepID=UPI002A36953E|nr:hypothetical protein [Sulfurovum sp.]MDY0403877.1 hypothetical protein [Sulfurovum sp.]